MKLTLPALLHDVHKFPFDKASIAVSLVDKGQLPVYHIFLLAQKYQRAIELDSFPIINQVLKDQAWKSTYLNSFIIAHVVEDP